MPVMAKTTLNSKNPSTVAKKVSGTGGGILGGQGSSEVVCPLQNADGSVCRKKCIGNFAYRSICEHIRRAHPDNWIPKLPASAETFAKMVSLSRGGIPSGAFPLVRKPIPSAINTGYRKASKCELIPLCWKEFCNAMPKLEDDQYIDGMSPPSSANESETLHSISLSTNPANFQSKFPAAMSDFEHDEDEDSFMDDEEMGIDSHEERSGTETEDDERRGRVQHAIFHRGMRGISSPHIKDFNFINQEHRSGSSKRKRQAHPYGDSTESSMYGSRQSSLGASRWDELIEAATTRAVVEVGEYAHYHHIHDNNDAPQTPPSPPTTASSSHAPILTASPSSRQSIFSPSSRCLICATCENPSPIGNSFACTECMAGFCADCAFSAGKRGSCGECRAVGAKFKPLRIIVR
ncbi:uncharacterized protein H6S33_001027 [Morchella sextelata]|uniref:uncharacterized protein n=1 Tax=Morchella sextelata TaxID=1174677 RepID=UPI001D05B643|nr:uncharacterized protein H6S33_001027 [Morchella sextelata]KAH0608799.1 hypothetical protein H6S33_001027 [Morchella sextelata]